MTKKIPGAIRNELGRPNAWEMFTLLFLVLLFVSPGIVLAAGAAWGWALFLAIYFWPALGMVAYRFWQPKSGVRTWPRIIGGPSITWGGKSYGMLYPR